MKEIMKNARKGTSHSSYKQLSSREVIFKRTRHEKKKENTPTKSDAAAAKHWNEVVGWNVAKNTSCKHGGNYKKPA